jgi:hypothetical protein
VTTACVSRYGALGNLVSNCSVKTNLFGYVRCDDSDGIRERRCALSILRCVDTSHDGVSPTLTSISTPERPSDSTSRRESFIATIESLPLLVNSMSSEVGTHTAYGLDWKF